MQFGTRIALTLMAIVPSAGCAGDRTPMAGPVAAIAPAFPTGVSVDPNVIAPADTLSVIVYREPDLSLASVVVAPDGTINMLLAGPVPVAGRTPAEVARALTTQLGRYLVDPRVSVNVVSSPIRSVTVEGAVGQPGIYAYVPNMSLLGAVAQARGTTRVARSDSVTVIRRLGAERYLAVFDIAAIRSGTSADVTLQAGDTVVVGVSGRRQTWQDFLQAAPLIGLFTRL